MEKKSFMGAMLSFIEDDEDKKEYVKEMNKLIKSFVKGKIDEGKNERLKKIKELAASWR